MNLAHELWEDFKTWLQLASLESWAMPELLSTATPGSPLGESL